MLGPWPPPYGGVQTHIVALREGLREAGAEVGIFNLTRHRGVAGDGVFFPDGPVALLRQLRRFRPDVVHIHLGGHITPRLLALLTACRALFGPAIVVTIHSGGYPGSPRGQQLTRASPEGFVFRSMRHVIVVNEALHTLFLRIGVAPGRVSTLLPTLRVPAPADALPPPLSAFVASGGPLILTVGLLEDEYLIPVQLDAFARLRASVPDARFVIVGSGSREAALRDAIASAGLDDTVLLNGDTLHPVTIALMLRSAVLWRITAFDGDSVSVREALALGLPVLATDTGMRPAGVRLTTAAAADVCAATLALLRGDVPSPQAAEASDLPSIMRAQVACVIGATQA